MTAPAEDGVEKGAGGSLETALPPGASSPLPGATAPRGLPVLLLSLGLVVLAVASLHLPILLPLRSTGRAFLRLTWDVLPLFGVGLLSGALIETYLPDRWIARVFGRAGGVRSIAGAVAAGALLPGCACSTVPTAAGIGRRAGVSLGAVTAFIAVGPLLSPVTVALTWGMLGWRMTVARVLAALVGSMGLGLVVHRYTGWFRVEVVDPSPAVPAAAVTSACCADASCQGLTEVPAAATADSADQPSGLWLALSRIIRSVAPYFLIGMALAAVLTTLVPAGAIPKLLGGASGAGAYLLAALVGIPLYVCEGEEVPLTYALLASGLAPGPALTFLLGSVGTCIPTMLMARRVIGTRATGVYIVYWVAFTVVSGLAFQAASSLA
jgi:uncharacterized membrane protein YraQ (UPF0718 family)